MPREAQWPPRIQLHRKSGQARVRVNRQDYYLGPFGSDEAARKYAELVARGRPEPGARPPGPHRLTVAEAAELYERHAEAYYRKPDGRPTGEMGYVRAACRALLDVCPRMPAEEFRARALKEVREHMVKKGWCRRNVNHHTNTVKRVWKWLCSEELVPAECHASLRAVEALKAGRTAAPERPRVPPADPAHVEATLPHLTPHLAAAARVQLYSACRPGEALALDPAEVERAGEVWLWRPESHKTAYRGKGKLILLGPKAQAVLLPLLEAHPGGLLFSPRRSEALRRAAVRAGARSPRRSPLAGRHPVGDRYTVEAYDKAIGRACRSAGVPHWNANQLRHLAATVLAAKYGPVVAQTILGHANLRTTEVYAEVSLPPAVAAVAETG